MSAAETAWAVKFRAPGETGWLWHYDAKNDRYGNSRSPRFLADRAHALRMLKWARQDGYEARLVRVVQREAAPAGGAVTLEHHLATVAMVRRAALDEAQDAAETCLVAEAHIAGQVAGRAAALDEARRSIARKVHLFDATRATVIEECLAAIDALRGST